MRANKSKDTKPELALRRELHRRGMRYRIHHRPVPDRPHTADVAFPRKRVAVFVDGCFWHGCPEHWRAPKTNPDFWLAKVRGNRRRDHAIDLELAARGWRVVRAWEHERVRDVADRVQLLVGPWEPGIPLGVDPRTAEAWALPEPPTQHVRPMFQLLDHDEQLARLFLAAGNAEDSTFWVCVGCAVSWGKEAPPRCWVCGGWVGEASRPVRNYEAVLSS